MLMDIHAPSQGPVFGSAMQQSQADLDLFPAKSCPYSGA
jgi:hypothetical protein